MVAIAARNKLFRKIDYILQQSFNFRNFPIKIFEIVLNVIKADILSHNPIVEHNYCVDTWIEFNAGH